jgi:hypothetical protein
MGINMSEKIELNTIEYVKALGKSKIETFSNKRRKGKLARLMDVCEQMINNGLSINATNIEKWTKEDDGELISASALYADRKKEQPFYTDILDEFINICPFSSKSRKSTKSSTEPQLSLATRVEINNLRQSNKMLKNILAKQFNIQDASSLVSISEIVKGGSAGNDSVDVKSIPHSLSETQRVAIRTILGQLMERNPEVSIVGEGDGERLFDGIKGKSILNNTEFKSLQELIE